MRYLLFVLVVVMLAGCGVAPASPPSPRPPDVPTPTTSIPATAPPATMPPPGAVPSGTLFVTRLDQATRTTEIVQLAPSSVDATASITLTTCVTDGCMIEGLALAPDGRHLAYARRSTQTNRAQLVLHDLGTHTEQVVVTDADLIEQPVFAPDSQRLAYLVGTTGQDLDVRQDLYVAAVDGTPPTLLLAKQRFLSGLRWHPNSSTLFFAQASDGPPPSGYAIFQLPRAGGEPALVLERAQLVDLNPTGDQLLVRTEQGQGQWGLALYTPRTAELRAFDLAGWSVFEADWSPTGMIVATAAQSPALPSAIIAFDADATVVPAPHETGLAGLLEPHWMGSSDTVAVMNTTAGMSQLIAVSFPAGTTTPPGITMIADPATNFYVPSYAVVP